MSSTLRHFRAPFKNDLVLARYSCVALQRISGSVKKVKGTLMLVRLSTS